MTPQAVKEALAAMRGVLRVADRATQEFDALRASIAALESLQAAQGEVVCTCGFGGFHDDINPRCERNAHPLPDGAVSLTEKDFDEAFADWEAGTLLPTNTLKAFSAGWGICQRLIAKRAALLSSKPEGAERPDCSVCGHDADYHAASGEWCPVKPGSGKWLDTKYLPPQPPAAGGEG